MRSLYVCYFNTDEPLVHTQVLPYLRAVARSGVAMHLLTYEHRSVWVKGERKRRRDLKTALGAEGIRWHALKYHSRPSLLATAFDVLLGAIYSAWLITRHRIGVLHARSHVPGVICLPLSLLLGRKLIFDLRGLMAEEYVDNGVWSENSLSYRLVKSAERALLKHADRVITLTDKLKAVLVASSTPRIDESKISVIPCCVDLSNYDRADAARLRGSLDHLKLVYVGSATGRYLLSEMIEFFKALKSKLTGAHFLVITKANESDVRLAFRAKGVDDTSFSIVSAAPAEVADLVRPCDVGISFITPSYALTGASPTKMGEYLAAGLPLVSTPGIGDSDSIIQNENVGVIVDGLDAASYDRAADRLIDLLRHDGIRERCRSVAEARYSLSDVGEPKYVAVYNSLDGVRASVPGVATPELSRSYVLESGGATAPALARVDRAVSSTVDTISRRQGRRNVLFVAYYYPPLGGMGSQRSQKFARYLPDHGWDPIVVTPERGSYLVDHSLDDGTSRGVEIVRTPYVDLSSVLKRALSNGNASNSHTEAGNVRPFEGGAAIGWFRQLVRNWLYIPDGQIGWYPYAVQAGLRAFESSGADAIYSSSFPATSLLIGRRLKQATNKPWIADFRDLWSEFHYADHSSAFRHRIDQVLESDLLDDTDALIAVSDLAAETLRRLSGGRKRVVVIRNGFDASEFANVEFRSPEKWTITFVGTFYGVIQDPTHFLQALRRLIESGKIPRREVEFKIVGEPDSFVEDLIQELNLADVTRFTGFVPHNESLGHQVNSSLLILILYGDRANAGTVSGKLYEYLGARRPILAMIPSDFEAARIIRETRSGSIVDPADEAGIERCLMDSYLAYKSGISEITCDGDLSQYERSYGTRQLAELFDEVTAELSAGRAKSVPRALPKRHYLRTLYLCYFGLAEPLVQTQVLPYLRELSKRGIDVSLLTFEANKSEAWPEDTEEATRRQLEAEGIRWFSRAYHKRPRLVSTLFDVVAGAMESLRIVRAHDIDVLHARAHVPMAIALILKRLTRCRLVFDIRGLMAEEYADAETWAEGSLIFRVVKLLEKTGIKQSDQIVVLTQRMKAWLVERKRAVADRVEVIPCCVDFARFNASNGDRSQVTSGRFEMIYAGAASGLYLVDEMARFFLDLRELQPDAFLRILTTTPRDKVVAKLMRNGLEPRDFWVGPVAPAEVPAYLKRARLGISFRKPTFSQIAASPTKIPEYLAAGIPVVCNSGVGDMDDLVEGSDVGVVVRSFDKSENAELVKKALAIASRPGIAARCIEVANRNFDLERVGAAAYSRVYQRIRKQNSRDESATTVIC